MPESAIGSPSRHYTLGEVADIEYVQGILSFEDQHYMSTRIEDIELSQTLMCNQGPEPVLLVGARF